jgi:predicted nucleic acid-binding protein
MEIWRQLVVQYQVFGKNGHDAHLAAAKLRHGVTHILTFNGKDFERFVGLTVLSPSSMLGSVNS